MSTNMINAIAKLGNAFLQIQKYYQSNQKKWTIYKSTGHD